MFSVKGTVFIKLQFLLDIPPIFLGGVILPLAFGTLQGDKFNRRLF
jgi:hypothetical protein